MTPNRLLSNRPAPHAAPADHALHRLLGLMRHDDGTWFSDDEAQAVMSRLREFPHDDEPVFQSFGSSTPSRTRSWFSVVAKGLLVSSTLPLKSVRATSLSRHFFQAFSSMSADSLTVNGLATRTRAFANLRDLQGVACHE